MDNLIELREYDPKILGRLLADKTTGKNIIWATDSYSDLGEAYQRNQQIQLDHIHRTNLLQPRIFKSQEIQKERTKKKAEVFTPAWICNLMNNQIDEEWFGRQNVFNRQTDKSWTTIQNSIEFGKETDWKDYVKTKILEIACGEAPYLVSRYDASTGKEIPIEKRIGMLDRKLRIVTENTDTPEDWYKWAIKALQSTYGYEFQGDSLYLGRVNVYLTFEEAMENAWHLKLTRKQKNEVSNTICWNLFQMDGLTDNIPIGIPHDRYSQISLFDDPETFESEEPIAVKINWWDNRASFKLKEMKENYSMGNRKLTRGGQKYLNSESSVISPKKRRKFGVVIGNPPYQQEGIGHNTKTPPVYNLYIDAAERLGVVSVLIHPARFLFNAGSTPKPWNQKMLSDIHFKVLEYEPDSKKWFQNVDIKGGMAITYHDSESVFTPIGTFVPFKELRSILSKTKEKTPESIMFSVYSPVGYKFTQKMHDDYPQIAQMLSKGNEFEVKTNVLQKLDNIVFFNDKPTDEYEYVQIYGLEKGKRLFKWIRREYISVPDNFQSYKVFLPEANGSGAIGEILSTPVVGQPIVGHTQTFISIGNFNNLSSAKCLLKYIKTKFARVMLGTLKTTQHNSISTWANVPLQDFTSNSDIDWSKSIPEIDQQLYRKYGLSPEEIDFIETHVKEMD